MTVPTNANASSFSISNQGAPIHDRSLTAWGRKLATEDEMRSAELAAIFRRNRAPRERKTNVGDVYGALKVVSHLPKSGSHSRVLVACERGHERPFRSDLLRWLGERATCRVCRSGST